MGRPTWSVRAANDTERILGYPPFPVLMRGRYSVGQAQDLETANFIAYACNKQEGHNMDIWHRHETVGDDIVGMEHAHEGGENSHHHDIPAQAVFNNYAGTIDGPDESGRPTVDDPALAAGEANDAAAEKGELAGDNEDEADDEEDDAEDDDDA